MSIPLIVYFSIYITRRTEYKRHVWTDSGPGIFSERFLLVNIIDIAKQICLVHGYRNRFNP